MNMQKKLEIALNEETAILTDEAFEKQVNSFKRKFKRYIDVIEYSESGDLTNGIEIYFKKSSAIMETDMKKMMATPLFKKAMYTFGGNAKGLFIILMPTG